MQLPNQERRLDRFRGTREQLNQSLTLRHSSPVALPFEREKPHYLHLRLGGRGRLAVFLDHAGEKIESLPGL